MDFLLAKMAAKSTGNISPYYPLMLKPGTVYIPERPPPGDAKPDIDNTSSMTSSPEITEVLPVRTRTLPMDSAPIHRSWIHSTNQNQDDALAIVNDEIEVQAEFQIR